MRLSRLILAAALVGAFCLAASASASATPSTSCEAEGSVKLSPGLTKTAHMQNVQIKGTVKNCAGTESEEFKGGSFQIHETVEASCEALGTGAAATGGPLKIKWSPKPAAGKMSAGTASVELIEGLAPVSGSIASGPFTGEAVSGSLAESFERGPECGQMIPHGHGTKEAKKVNKGHVSGTLSIA
jgi:hypothetical protein